MNIRTIILVVPCIFYAQYGRKFDKQITLGLIYTTLGLTFREPEHANIVFLHEHIAIGRDGQTTLGRPWQPGPEQADMFW